MRLKNTSKFNTALCREIIKFTRPPGISNFDIWVKHSKAGWGGRAYWAGCSLHSTRNPFVVIRVDKNIPCPVTLCSKNGYLGIRVFTPIELLVLITAHELRHLWQKIHPKGYRVWGARGRFSERDADAYALHKLREWCRK